MVLTDSSYYSREADLAYMSVSQYKDMAGTYGKLGCEFRTMEKLSGRWDEEPTTAMLVGSYLVFSGLRRKIPASSTAALPLQGLPKFPRA